MLFGLLFLGRVALTSERVGLFIHFGVNQDLLDEPMPMSMETPHEPESDHTTARSTSGVYHQHLEVFLLEGDFMFAYKPR